MEPLALPSGGFDVTKSFTDRVGNAEGDSAVQKAAEEFEAVFVSLMLKSMRQSMSKEMFQGDDSDTFGGLFDSFMGQHIAEQGGIGLNQFFDSLTKLGENSDLAAAGSQKSPNHHKVSLEAYRNAGTTIT